MLYAIAVTGIMAEGREVLLEVEEVESELIVDVMVVVGITATVVVVGGCGCLVRSLD